MYKKKVAKGPNPLSIKKKEDDHLDTKHADAKKKRRKRSGKRRRDEKNEEKQQEEKLNI